MCIVPKDEVADGEDGQEDEPEPEEDVDLLVGVVERHDAERVNLLHGARRAELSKGALGHLGKESGHGVCADSRVLGGNSMGLKNCPRVKLKSMPV